MIKKLRRTFILINMTIVTVILSAVFLVMLFTTRSGVRTDSLLVLQRAAAGEIPGGSFSESIGNIQIPFFTVDVDSSGKIAVVNGSYYRFDNPDTLRALVSASLDAAGNVDTIPEFNLRFYRQKTPCGVRIAYADVSLENSFLSRFFNTTLLLFAGALLVFWGISVLLARWAIKPVEKAWDQQRQFVADASHELRTPLTVVMSNADMLLSRPDADPAKRSQWLTSIKSESQQMRFLVEQLLSLARVDAKKTQAGLREAADFSAAVSDCLLQFEAAFYENHRHVTSDIADHLSVRCPRQQVQQLVENLVSNAVKYGDSSGIIHISLDTRGRMARLIVANTGREIPREQLKRIFERFTRLDSARESGAGYGLGLAICKGIVEQCRGKIFAESTGGWNRFIVELPLKKG